MAEATRKGLLFAAGLLVGGALAVWGYLSFIDQPPGPVPVVVRQPVPAPAAPQPSPAAPALATAPPAGSCPQEAAVAASGPQDGQFNLAGALATSAGSAPGAFLQVAREVNAAGRVRDAEVALIVACRLAERASGFQSAPLADAKVELAQHYAVLGAREQSTSQRRELLQRAETLLADSVQAYTAALGRNASKTRQADRQLTALVRIPLEPPAVPVEALPPEPGRASAQAMRPVPPPPNPFAARGALPQRVEPAAQAEPVEPAAPVAQAEPAEPAAPVEPVESAEPASDARALGAAPEAAPERPVQRSAELRQLDSDLQRLYAQARAVSEDRAGLERRHQAALARRDACGDNEACLRRWYSERRRQLFTEF